MNEATKLADKFDVHFLEPFGIRLTVKNGNNHIPSIDGAILSGLIRKFRVVLLRGCGDVESESLVNFSKTIGPLLEWDFGSVMEMRAHEEPKNYLFTHGPVPFHWDGAFHRAPHYLLFNCIEAPELDSGGETVFCDTTRILRSLDAKERNFLAGHSLTYKTEKLAHYGGEISVPLVQDNLDIQEKILRFAEPVPSTMLNPVEVSVDGLDMAEAGKLIDGLVKYCYREENCYTHSWVKNDLLIADNHTLLHARRAFKKFSPRHLRRIQIL